MFVLVIFLFSLVIIPVSFSTSAQPHNISFPSFDDSGSCGTNGSLICMGSVRVGNGCLNITPEDPNSPMNQIGRVLYRHPVLAWPASISTIFTVRIIPKADSKLAAGDGMAFVLVQDSRPSPSQSFGSFVGTFDHSTQGVLRQLAVEFGTYKNENVPDGNHIAIIAAFKEKPIGVKSLDNIGIDLKSGREITVKIEYDGWGKNLQIYIGYKGDPLVSFLNQTVKMKSTVPSSVYAGFTAATGLVGETHQVVSWNFTSIELPKRSLGREKKKIWVIVVIPIIVVVVLVLAAVSTRFVLSRGGRRRKKGSCNLREEIIAASNGPKLFSCRQLSKATHNFSQENLLGAGGFGSVYKGLILDSHVSNTQVAVKRISSTSKQGEKEYLAEICTIGCLRHKNLLQLQGWCHDSDQLLLVYDYMPNGSLDRFIGKGKKNSLDWKTRYNILLGLASALVYLHEECGHPVVHRDVKPNNVLLDSEFNPHLGDFGLARSLQKDQEASATTVVAGTPGYLAPEVSFTGRATPESDVYSFGMVALELVCGRRSKGFVHQDSSLVDGVWDLYEKGLVLDCVDELLEGKYQEEQVRRSLVVGLACLHPQCGFRPRMRKVVQIFMNPDEPLMDLPESRPSLVCLSFNASSSASTTTDCGSTRVPSRGLTESLPDDST